MLIVDDDPRVRSAVARALRAEGIEVTTAATGEEALALAQAQRFGTVISELRMPGMGGIAMLQRMSVRQPGSRFVILTAATDVDPGLVPPGHRTCVVRKPWTQEALLGAVLWSETPLF